MCIDGKDEVYFKDSCGNPANIYDANMDILQTVYNLPLQLLANNTLTSNNIQGNNSGNSINSMVNNGIQI
jgi:hypothetical protein